MKIEDSLRQRVRTIMPDLVVEQLEINQDGLVNDIVIVNQELVFRFTRLEDYNSILQSEIKILDLIRPHIRVNIPTPVFQSQDCIVYPYLKGLPLTRSVLLHLNEQTQNRLARQLGGFLQELHSTDLTDLDWEMSSTFAPTTREQLLERRQKIREQIHPLLLPHQVDWVEDLFAKVLADDNFFQHAPGFVHGDLAPYHILFDEKEMAITGVIDFGVAGIRDPALDFGSLLNGYGERFVTKMSGTYPQLDAVLPRARFFAQEIELQWVLRGLDSGESFWFTAHIAGARDILS